MWEYYWKSLKMFLLNFLFGLFPLVLVWFINVMFGGINTEEQKHLIRDGVVIFVSIACMGGVMVEFLLSRHKFRGPKILAIFLFPVALMWIVGVEYLLVVVKKIDHNVFDLDSSSTIFVFLLSFIYSTFAKANLYFLEDLNIVEEN